MKASILWVQITYLDETWTQEFQFFGDWQSILDYAQDDWYDEIGSNISDFDWDLYKLDYQVRNVEKSVVSLTSNS
jgi:hypothetical protein